MREYLLVLAAFIAQSALLWGLTNANVELSTAKFVVHRGPTLADFYPLTDSRALVDNLDLRKNTVLYLHGFVESLNSKSMHVIAESYLTRNDTNLIILDWAELADGDYIFDAVPNAKKLGPYLGTVLLEMFNYGLDIQKFHVVGHSLGAHLASMVGREILKNSNGAKKLKRITALDPALALFYFTAGLNKHLTKDDAEFVDVIHTDAWLYGTPISSGTVDFWPNGGTTLQPGCPTRDHIYLSENDLCSHKRSWLYWAESVVDRVPAKFNAVAAKSWFHFKIGRTEPDQGVVMGHNCPTNIHGSYYLQTNGETPLARGKLGLKYSH